ncbi:alpha/beta hydrolase [Ectothiorhodospiraceae bacterium WFHF3C12]|nr:alpha/beta hydrolase [Ectothiorhodospiraceae bacterium WFHF3C12]
MQHSSHLSLHGADGIRLIGDRFGPEDGPPVLLAHGGGQTRHAWRRSGIHLGNAGYCALSVDLRGHGESAWAPSGDYRVDRFAEDLLSVADGFDQAPVLVGASLGGISGLLAQGELAPRDGHRGFAGLILVDIAPRMSQSGVERVLGFMKENVDSGFASLEEAADAIARYLPHRRRPTSLSGLAKNLRHGDDGRYYWHWDPRFVTGPNRSGASRNPERLEAAAACISIPTLLVRGANSELVDGESARQFAALVPHAEFQDIAEAGHMVAGDRNDAFGEAILDFLARRFSLDTTQRSETGG